MNWDQFVPENLNLLFFFLRLKRLQCTDQPSVSDSNVSNDWIFVLLDNAGRGLVMINNVVDWVKVNKLIFLLEKTNPSLLFILSFLFYCRNEGLGRIYWKWWRVRLKNTTKWIFNRRKQTFLSFSMLLIRCGLCRNWRYGRLRPAQVANLLQD